MAEQEDEFPIETTMGVTDNIRAIIQGISSRISLSNLAKVLTPLITTTDNQNTVRSESTNTSLQSNDEVLLMDCTGGDRAVLLMDASDVFDTATNVGQAFYIKRIDKTAANDCQVNTTGGQTIDLDPNFVLNGSATELNWIKIQSTGSAWNVIG